MTLTRHLLEGQVQYRPELFAACVADYDRPCEEPASFCPYEVLRGLVPDGQHCQDYEVCDKLSTCLQVNGGTCGEVCARVPFVGEACGFYCGGTTPCLAFEYCGPDLACVNNVCVQPKEIGASCGGADPVPCSALLHCTAESASPARPEPAPAATILLSRL